MEGLKVRMGVWCMVVVGVRLVEVGCVGVALGRG